MSRTILVVDDEPRIVELARDYLEHAGFRGHHRERGTGRARRPRGATGPTSSCSTSACPVSTGSTSPAHSAASATATVPIVMVTARDDELDKLLGLELGADDYLTKPFSPRELVARVKAVLRRTDRPTEPADRDPRRRPCSSTFRGCGPRSPDTAIDLTPTEFTLLATLARQPGRIFTRSQLLDALHGVAFESYERAIDSHIKNLRRKLEPDPRQPRYVLTVYGVGYRLADDR